MDSMDGVKRTTVGNSSHSSFLPCSDLEGLYTNEVASMVRVNGHHEGSMPLGKSQLLV